jgi:hypothetical protein
MSILEPTKNISDNIRPAMNIKIGTLGKPSTKNLPADKTDDITQTMMLNLGLTALVRLDEECIDNSSSSSVSRRSEDDNSKLNLYN